MRYCVMWTDIEETNWMNEWMSRSSARECKYFDFILLGAKSLNTLKLFKQLQNDFKAITKCWFDVRLNCVFFTIVCFFRSTDGAEILHKYLFRTFVNIFGSVIPDNTGCDKQPHRHLNDPMVTYSVHALNNGMYRIYNLDI